RVLFRSALCATAQAREYSVSTVLSDAFPWGQAAQKWADLVNERSAGRITLRVYPNAQLVAGDQTKEFSAMRSGLIDMAVGSTINWSPQVPELNLFSLRSEEHTSELQSRENIVCRLLLEIKKI